MLIKFILICFIYHVSAQGFLTRFNETVKPIREKQYQIDITNIFDPYKELRPKREAKAFILPHNLTSKKKVVKKNSEKHSISSKKPRAKKRTPKANRRHRVASRTGLAKPISPYEPETTVDYTQQRAPPAPTPSYSDEPKSEYSPDPYAPAPYEPNPYDQPVEIKYDETYVGQYYYGRKGEGNTTFPLPSCFYNPSGYVCCNLMLNELLATSYEEVQKEKTKMCNIQKIANRLQKHTEKIFSANFETIVALEDFSQKIHFKDDLVCKTEIDGRFILAYGTPITVDKNKIIPPVPAKNIVKESTVLKEELRRKIQKIDNSKIVAN